MPKNEHNPENVILRQNAELLLQGRAPHALSPFSEFEMLKLIHELEVHQIELDMQNNELTLAKERDKAAEKYTELYDFAPVGYFTLSREGEILELNLFGANKLGKVRSMLKNKLFISFVSPDSQQTFNQFFSSVFQTLKKETCEIGLLTQGVKPVFVLLTGVVAENGLDCLLTFIDISERRLSEHAIQNSLETLTKIAGSVPGVVFQYRLHPDGTSCFPYSSEAIRSIYGVSPLEVKEDDSAVFAVIHPDDYDMMVSSIGKSAKELTPLQHEYRVKYKDGTIRHLLGNSLPELENDGSVLWHGFITDITNRVKVEDELNLLGKQIILAQKIGHTGSWQYEIGADKMFVSEEAFEIFGLPSLSNYFTLKEIEDCTPDRERVHQAMVDLIRDESEYNLKFLIHPADGSNPKTVLSIAQLERDTKGLPLKVIGFVQDISTFAKIQEELELKNIQLNQVMAEKDKFFSLIAHDLRGPLNGFVDLAQILVEDLPTLDLVQIQKMALLMRNTAANVFSLVDNLLEWSRMQRGLIVFAPEKFNLEENAKNILETVLESARNKEIVTQLNIPESLQLFADPNMFSSTLRNLVSNAVKFTPKGGTIILSTRPIDEKTIEISVMDNGIGMSESLLKKLFDLSQHSNRLGTEKELGTGLGLLLSKEFVEKNGGKLRVESVENKGSTFYFTSPISANV